MVVRTKRMYHYLFLLLFPVVIQSQNVSSWGELRLNGTVISPYRTAFILLNENVVDKLVNVDLVRADRSLPHRIDELYCTIKKVYSNLKQATSANDDLVRQIDIDVDQLVDW